MDIHSALKIHICNVCTRVQDAKWRLPDQAQIESTYSQQTDLEREGVAPHQEPRPHGTLRVPDSTIRGRRSAPPPFSTITWLPEPRSENIVRILNDRQNRYGTTRSIPSLLREPSFNEKDVSFSGGIARTPDRRAMTTS